MLTNSCKSWHKANTHKNVVCHRTKNYNMYQQQLYYFNINNAVVALFSCLFWQVLGSIVGQKKFNINNLS